MMKEIIAFSLLISLCLNVSAGYPKKPNFPKNIKQFEANDKIKMPPEGAIVCIGSSSMRGWHGSIKKDLAPLTVIRRGFGGSTMNDALAYVDNIVINYKPVLDKKELEAENK